MKRKILTLVILAIFIAVVNLTSGFSAGYYTGRALQAREVTGMGGGMAQLMPPMGGPMPVGGPPATIAANASFVYILAGGKLIQYDAKTLEKKKEVQLEIMPPGSHSMMEGGMRPPGGK